MSTSVSSVHFDVSYSIHHTHDKSLATINKIGTFLNATCAVGKAASIIKLILQISESMPSPQISYTFYFQMVRPDRFTFVGKHNRTDIYVKDGPHLIGAPFEFDNISQDELSSHVCDLLEKSAELNHDPNY